MTSGLLSNETMQKVEALRNRIAADRDALRDLISELEDIADSADEAVEALNNAADAMSRYL